MKTILVPCDFSAQSKAAFRFAVALAEKVKGEVVLMHALTLTSSFAPGLGGELLAIDPAYFMHMEDDVKRDLEAMKRKVRRRSVKVTLQILNGDLVTAVNTVVRKKSIDLVIMGTSGVSGVTEFLIGSNTEKVVRYSKVPVLATSHAPDLKAIKNILVPFTPDLRQRGFMKELIQLQKLFKATLHLLLVGTPDHFWTDSEAFSELLRFAEHYKLAHYKVHFRNHLRESDGIIDFASSEKMDLIAMGTHARKGLAHLFSGSLTEKMIKRVHTPIWTCALKKATRPRELQLIY